MGLRRRLAFVLVAVLGAAVAILPAVASSETSPSIQAYEYGSGYKYHYWQPATVTIAPGGAVQFGNPYAESKHGLQFTGGPATPSCSGIPAAAGEASGATAWHGECSFAAAGTYTFICTVHPTEMKGTITVSPSGTTTISTTPSPTNTVTQPAGSSGGSGSTPSAGEPGSSASPGSPGSPFATATVRLAAGSRSRSVSGSVDIATAAAGGRLEVDLLAARAALARAGAPALVTVGRLLRSGVPAGIVRFKVDLDARAVRALRAHRRLALTVRIVLTPPGGSADALPSRTLTLRR